MVPMAFRLMLEYVFVADGAGMVISENMLSACSSETNMEKGNLNSHYLKKKVQKLTWYHLSH